MTTAQELVTSYLQWLKKRITIRETGGWIELTTPFLDRHNDHLQIYVEVNGDQLLLTDDGYTISDLALSGWDLSTDRRRELLETILAGFSVQRDGDALIAQATPATFAQRKHALLQAMLAVNDLFATSRTTVKSLFFEDVEHFLRAHQVRFVPSVQMSGRSGLSHTFDYVIPGWIKAPERIVEAINNPTKDKVTSLLFKWNDVSELRKHPVTMIAVMNDSEKRIPEPLVNACKDYGVRVVPWTQRESVIESLIA